MHVFIGILAVLLLLGVLLDAFETIVLPRRIPHKFRFTRGFYRATWIPWARLAHWMPAGKRRDTYLSFFGPLSLLLLLICWAIGLVFAFAMWQWAIGAVMRVAGGNATAHFWAILYMSASTFVTLGMGDVTPISRAAKALTVLEAGMGFGFLALIISYLPVIYQSFSRREVNISLLDARAGSPPAAAELLRRHAHDHGMQALHDLLRDWERWSAELLESHLSYPVLAYFRSQHDNQSWLAALTTILDTCALAMAGLEGACPRQAELTFAMARHAVVDLAQVFLAPPHPSPQDRLPSSDLARLRGFLASTGLRLRDDAAFPERLASCRQMYEPYVYSLSVRLLMPLPHWLSDKHLPDNWQTSAWEHASRVASREPAALLADDHL